MKKTISVLAFLMAAVMLLTGCRFKTVDELYTLPQAPTDYKNLQTSLKQVQQELETEYGSVEYAAPLNGANTQTVQLQDLDGDGVSEAVAFFRVSGAEQPLKIYIFHQQDDGSYRVYDVIGGDGTAISSVAYEDLTGDKKREMIVSWQMSDDVHTLSAFTVEDGASQTLLAKTYTQYQTVDIDQDGVKEILLVQLAAAENASAGSTKTTVVKSASESAQMRVEYYDYASGAKDMEMVSYAPVSNTAAEFYSMRTGATAHGISCFYLTDKQSDGELITDIYTVTDGALKNITLSENSGRSSSTVCSQEVPVTDINADGVLEIPNIVSLQQPSGSSTSITWLVRWVQYDESGEGTAVYTTFYNASESWYLVLPDDWVGEISVSQSGSSALGLRGTTFSYWDGSSSVSPQAFLTIYRLTGSNRKTRAESGDRFILAENSSVIYAAEFTGGWDSGLTKYSLGTYFHLIETEW